MNPNLAYVYRVLDEACLAKAEQAHRQGRSPAQDLQQAKTMLDKGLAIKDDFNELWFFVGRHFLLKAK